MAAALQAWHEAGTAAGDLAFWREHAEQFRSPKAYALVVDALLEQRDPVAAMALLVQWLSQAERDPADRGGLFLLRPGPRLDGGTVGTATDGAAAARQAGSRPAAAADRWALARKFLDYLEANAEQYWQVPQFELAAAGRGDDDATARKPRSGDEADDSVRRRLRGHDLSRQHRRRLRGRDARRRARTPPTSSSSAEAERIVGRLTFLATLAQLWKLAAVASFGRRPAPASATRCWRAGWPRPRQPQAPAGAAVRGRIATASRRRAARTSRWSNTTAAAA